LKAGLVRNDSTDIVIWRGDGIQSKQLPTITIWCGHTVTVSMHQVLSAQS